MMNGAGGLGHGRSRPPLADDELRRRPDVVEGPLTQQGHGSCPGGCRRVGVTVAVLTRHAAEQVTRLPAGGDLAMVELDVANENPERIADDRFRLYTSDDLAEGHGTGHRPSVLSDTEETGGEMSKCRKAYRMIVENTGAAAVPPK
jgi:hypothetical protein